MINEKDHPELYAAKLRRFDRWLENHIAEHRQHLQELRLQQQAELLDQQADEPKECHLQLVPDESSSESDS